LAATIPGGALMSNFVDKFGGVYEHSRWVAEEAESIVADAEDMETIAMVMADCVDNAAVEKQLALIRAHPDLAGKAQIAGELTADSTSEQASAGLDQCSIEEYERFQSLNEAYRDKFGFPFVMAVRNSSLAEILDAFGGRLENDPDVEFETALAEIHKIARLRLEAMQ
jgi:OHCU decarboxylase